MSRALSRLDSPQKPRAGIQVNECNGPSMRRPVGVKSILAVRGTRSDFISLGACWAVPFQPVLLSVGRRTLRLGLSQSFAPAAPAASGRLRPACSTNCCDLPDPIQMVSVCCEKFPALLRRSGANLFHCRSPFICALSTSMTWERTASRPETGLLIPSGYNTYWRTSHKPTSGPRR